MLLSSVVVLLHIKDTNLSSVREMTEFGHKDPYLREIF